MFIIVMGVSGCGKTTVGKLLAEQMDCQFYDGDDYHPAENIAKMTAGIALNDDDRAVWLATLANIIQVGLSRGECGVIACSALKEKYRSNLLVDPDRVKIVYLKGSYELILARMQSRHDHYMKPAMLKSQLDALEEPNTAFEIDITQPPEQIVRIIMDQLNSIDHFKIGIVGLGVMGRSLAQNFYRHGYPPIGYDLDPQLPNSFSAKVVNSYEELVAQLIPPRTILIMIPAGAGVDGVIHSLKPVLQKGDVLVDGGNSYFKDTERRWEELESVGIYYIGMGVSGGEYGALWGPSLMPGGSQGVWTRVEKIFQAIAAKADDGEPCVAWMGNGGAGHYVKMVHNGIEYADMQLIAEVYDLLHRGAGISNLELADIFASWNERELNSYLVEITAHVLRQVDSDTGQSLVDVILDEAVQKGTGKWASQSALEAGVATPTIHAAVESRFISALKTERVKASLSLGSACIYSGDKDALIAATEKALYASKIISYTQGLNLLGVAAREYGWKIDLSKVVAVWRAGCIIRASLLSEITHAYRRHPSLTNLLLEDEFREAVLSRQGAWRSVVQIAVGLGIPIQSISASLAYFDAYRSECLPANLTQAQRDYFGAHTYRRIDKQGVFHTEWQ